MGKSRYKIVDLKLPHFVTCTVLHWIPIFTRSETVQIILDSLSFLSKEGLNVHHEDKRIPSITYFFFN